MVTSDSSWDDLDSTNIGRTEQVLEVTFLEEMLCILVDRC